MKKLLHFVSIIIVVVAYFYNGRELPFIKIKTLQTHKVPLPKRALASNAKEDSTLKVSAIKERLQKSVRVTSKDKIVSLPEGHKKRRVTQKEFTTSTFTLKGQSLQIAREYSAIHKKDYYLNLGKKVSSVSDYIIYKGTSGLPVIQDSIKKIKGHATGHIIVKITSSESLKEIANRYDLKIAYAAPHLNLLSFIPKDKSRLLEISIKLSEYKIFDSVALDISYGAPHAK